MNRGIIKSLMCKMGCDYYYGYYLHIVYKDREVREVTLTEERGYYNDYDEKDLDDETYEDLTDKESEDMYRRHPNTDIYKNGEWLIANKERIEEYTDLARKEHDADFEYIKRCFYVRDR